MSLPVVHEVLAECRGHAGDARHERCPRWIVSALGEERGYREVRCACPCHAPVLAPLPPDGYAAIWKEEPR